MRPGARTDVGPPLRFLTAGPRLGFGAWAVGGTGWGATSAETDRLAAVGRALELGITFFDTAPTYGDGASESLLGRALKTDRDRVAIATQVGPRDDPRRSLQAYRPLAAGLLSGKYTAPPEFPAADHRRKIYWFKGKEFERRRTVVEQLASIARSLDMPLPGLALAWVLARPGVSIVLAGAR